VTGNRDQTTMAKPEIDQEKIRVFLRSLGNDDLLQLLDRAIGLLPRVRFPALFKHLTAEEKMPPVPVARPGRR